MIMGLSDKRDESMFPLWHSRALGRRLERHSKGLI